MGADIHLSRMWFTEAASQRCRVRRVLAACGHPKDEHAANSARWVRQTKAVRFAARMPLYDIGCALHCLSNGLCLVLDYRRFFTMGIPSRSQPIQNTDALANFKNPAESMQN
jgi:hypothetical protein